MPNTLLLPAWLVSDVRKEPLHNWGVRIVGDQIDDLGPHTTLLEMYPADDVQRTPGQALLPGFVNAHTHLYGVLAHGIPLAHAPSGFWAFLEEFWWPLVEDQLNQEMICAATELQCARMLKSGVTTFFDITEAPLALPGCLSAQTEIVRQWGMRAILTFEATERVSPRNGQLGLEENLACIEACEGEGSLVSGGMSFHTTFTCSAEFIRQAFALGRKRGKLVHMHCSEGTHEPAYTQDNFGLRPLHYYDSLGVTGPDMLASQCVQVDKSEIALLAEKQIRMTHMPLSNCEVGGGIAPVPDLLQAGVEVGLGSDGYIDDFYEVLRAAFLIHKASHQDPRVMPASTVWYLATEGGAKTLGLQKVGRLEKGWQADMQLVDLDLPTPLAAHNFYEQLLLYRCQANVRATYVAGRNLFRDGELSGADFQQLLAHAHQAAHKLWSRAAN